VRKRTIRADKVQRDPLFGGLPTATQYAYWILQCYADDDGRILWNDMYVGTCLSFPGLSIKGVGGMMSSLVAAGQVLTYEDGQQTYAVFSHWYGEQSIDRPGPPKYPAPPAGLRAEKPVRKQRKSARPKQDLLGAEPSPPKAELAKEGAKQRKTDTMEAALQEVFAFYVKVFEKAGSYVFSGARRKAVRLQLNAGYTVKQCKQAVVGNRYDPWSQGANDRKTAYNDLVFIFKDATRVDRYLEKFDRQKKDRDRGVLPAPEGGAESDHQSGEDILSDIFGPRE